MARSPALDRRVVALVRSIHGLRGVLRVEVLTDRPEERFAPGARLYPEGSEHDLVVASGEPVPDGPGWRLRFRGFDDRAAVEFLRDVYLEAAVPAVAERPAAPGSEAARPDGDRGEPQGGRAAGGESAAAGGPPEAAEPAANREFDEVFWDEVVGVPVTAPDGEALGTVTDVYRAGAAEVYVVEGGTRGPFDLPSVRGIVLEFAPRAGRIVVDPDLLDLAPPRQRRPRGRLTTRRAKRGEGSA